MLAPRAGLLEASSLKALDWLTSPNVQIEPKRLFPALANRHRDV
jgi:hypothetical protein